MSINAGVHPGRYSVVAPLGSGAKGGFCRARDDLLQRDVAIQILLEARWDDPRRRARFEREARALARITHSNILAIHDFGTDGGVETLDFRVARIAEGDSRADGAFESLRKDLEFRELLEARD